MDVANSDKVGELIARVDRFMDEHIFPYETEHWEFVEDENNLWQYPPWFEDLKAKAREADIWNWFLPKDYEEFSPGLSNAEFAPIMERMARVPWAQEVFNCSAPDRGNMEVLARFGSEYQQRTWLEPLLAGKMRSAFSMTEPAVASSDAGNLETTIQRDGDEYVINGRKWFTSNAFNPLCKIFVVMGKTDPEAPRHQQFSMILVPKDTPGVIIERPLRVFGSVHSPGGHAQVHYDNVRVPAENLILGEGRGFEIAQGRLGPGRFQYAMMFVGMASRCLELMCKRVEERVAFGEKLADKTSIQHDIARSRCEIEQCRLLVMAAAETMDRMGPKEARDHISMVKIVAPEMCFKVANRAIQAFGGMGFTQDTPIQKIFMTARFCQVADGPDVKEGETNPNFRFFDTICGATQERQDALFDMLNHTMDVLFVVGGYNSSNTGHLVEIGIKHVPSFFIRNSECLKTIEEILHYDLESKAEEKTNSSILKRDEEVTIGVTAGASCPNNLIEETIVRVFELRGIDKAQLVSALED